MGGGSGEPHREPWGVLGKIRENWGLLGNLLGGPWIVVSGFISSVAMFDIMAWVLITLLITSPGPPSTPLELPGRSVDLASPLSIPYKAP